MSGKRWILGLDIGGTNIRAGLVDEQNNIRHFEMTSSTGLFCAQRQDRIGGMADYIRGYCERYCDGKLPEAVSIGFPSTLNKQKTVLLSTPNLPGLDNLPVVELLEEKLHIPVLINRDVNLLMLYDMNDHQVPNKGVIIGCYFGTGLGNAIAIDGHFLSGKNGVAGELGHIPMVGCTQVCGCGNIGCMETLAAGRNLTEIQARHFPDEDINTLFLRHGDDPVLEQFVEILSIPVATEINIFDPDCVILGGGVLQMPAFPLALLKRYILNHARKPAPCEGLQIVFSRPSQESGAIGAGMYAFEQIRTGAVKA